MIAGAEVSGAPRALPGRVSEMWAAIGSAPDPWRVMWRGADSRKRRMFLTLAGLSHCLEARAWDEISAAHRGEIKRRSADLLEWLVDNVPKAGE